MASLSERSLSSRLASRRKAKPKTPKTLEQLQDEVAGLEAEAREVDAPRVPQDSPGLFRRVVDLISRPNFAVAGAVEEFLTTGRADLAAERAGREMFSGIGGLEGEKRAFGEVLENLGVGELGKLSDAAPFLFSETGEGLALQRGGALDPTGRGALGLVLDVAADPLTYVTFGTTPALRAATTAGRTLAFTRKGKAFFRRELAERLPEAGGRVALETAPEGTRKAAAALARDRAAQTTRERLEARFAALAGERELATANVLIRSRAAQAAERLMRREAVQQAVTRQADELLSAGIQKGDPLFRGLELAVRKQAADAIEEAAKLNPRLLDPGGIKIAGFFVPGTSLRAIAQSGPSKRLVQAVSESAFGPAAMALGQRVNRGLDSMGRIFSRDWITRNVRGYNLLKEAHMEGAVGLYSGIMRRVEDSPAMRWVAKQKPATWKAIVKAAESGTLDTLRTLDPRAIEAGQLMRQIFDDMAIAEQRVGLLEPERVVKNYVAHFYNNTADELLDNVPLFKKKTTDLGTLGRHNEYRVFDSLEEAERLAPNLRPVWNPLEIIERRARAHADGVAFRSWYETIAKEFGVPDLPYRLRDILPAFREAGVETAAKAKQFAQVEAAIAKGKTPLDFIRKLDPDMQTEFLRQRLLKVKDRKELAATLNKYAEFADRLPSWRRLETIPIETGLGTISINKLADVEIPVPIIRDLQDMEARVLQGREIHSLLNIWDKLNNTFKSWVTIYFPAFNFRNAYSNVAQSFLDVGVSALSPRLHAATVRMMAGLDGTFRTQLGQEFSYRELREAAENLGVSARFREFSQQTGTAKAIGGRFEKIPRKVALNIENEARIQLFLNHVRRGDDFNLAAQKVKEFLFDYGNLSRVEKEVFRRFIPFYTWTRKNITLQARALTTRPGRVAAEIKPFRGREEENGQMVSWDGEALKMRLDRDGKTVRMITGVDLPLRGLDVIWRGSLSETMRQSIGMVTPLLKTPVEVAAGKNLFLNRNLERAESGAVGRIVENMPRPIRRWMGWSKRVDPAGRTRYSFDGERFYLLTNLFFVSRVVSTSDRAFREYANDPSYANIMLDVATGLRNKEINLDEQQRRRLNERIRQLEDSLVRSGKRLRFSRTFVPKQPEGQQVGF